MSEGVQKKRRRGKRKKRKKEEMGAIKVSGVKAVEAKRLPAHLFHGIIITFVLILIAIIYYIWLPVKSLKYIF